MPGAHVSKLEFCPRVPLIVLPGLPTTPYHVCIFRLCGKNEAAQIVLPSFLPKCQEITMLYLFVLVCSVLLGWRPNFRVEKTKQDETDRHGRDTPPTGGWDGMHGRKQINKQEARDGVESRQHNKQTNKQTKGSFPSPGATEKKIKEERLNTTEHRPSQQTRQTGQSNPSHPSLPSPRLIHHPIHRRGTNRKSNLSSTGFLYLSTRTAEPAAAILCVVGPQTIHSIVTTGHVEFPIHPSFFISQHN